ncbi:hypothetical protein CHS0354_007915 [Potamilus streckersoni]|uniref:Mediator of RNA polymerase II transcription subunit 6 n=1 Tax=Potamilus streckersoni TaxID=2493646 RepID=A0AAE0VRE9_9BIVA|nr:hypothetical protein CHS0354_007915 [Potamilus streckersoni]
MATEKENPLFISWHDSNWIPMLNPSNILDYFSERSNPFYDRTCNNEVIKMQRLSQDQLSNMTGVEYVLLHAQDPILYIVRKQHRHSPQQVTPLADYYIIAGIVYQAPDLCSVINSRLLNAVYNLQTAFEEAHSYARYHPSRGYWWEFHDKEDSDKSDVKEKKKDEPSSIFQRQRVDLLLGELAKKFPPKFVAPSQPEAREEQVKVEPKQEVKQEKAEDKSTTSSVKPPPEKKPKHIR